MRTIVCVGTSRLYSEGAATLVEQCSNGRFRALASSPRECLHDSTTADLMIVDLPGSIGAALVREIHAAVPMLQVIAVIDPSCKDDIFGYTEVGVSGFFATDRSASELVALLMKVGGMRPRTPAEPLHRDARTHESREVCGLTPRQKEVLELIERGFSNKEIARELRVELPTVKNHVHQILSKTRLRRRTQAVHMMRNELRPRRAHGDTTD